MHKEMTLSRPVPWANAARLGLLLATALLITYQGWPQPVTGTLVNALLLLSVEWAGVGPAMLVGMVTPIGAATHGVLPLPLLVMVPFIAMSNAVLVGIYGALRERNRVLALVVGAVAKFALLYGVVALLMVRPLALATAGGTQIVKIPALIVYMMQWPQLATALAGGALALGVSAGVRWARAR